MPGWRDAAAIPNEEMVARLAPNPWLAAQESPSALALDFTCFDVLLRPRAVTRI